MSDGDWNLWHVFMLVFFLFVIFNSIKTLWLIFKRIQTLRRKEARERKKAEEVLKKDMHRELVSRGICPKCAGKGCVYCDFKGNLFS